MIPRPTLEQLSAAVSIAAESLLASKPAWLRSLVQGSIPGIAGGVAQTLLTLNQNRSWNDIISPAAVMTLQDTTTRQDLESALSKPEPTLTDRLTWQVEQAAKIAAQYKESRGVVLPGIRGTSGRNLKESSSLEGAAVAATGGGHGTKGAKAYSESKASYPEYQDYRAIIREYERRRDRDPEAHSYHEATSTWAKNNRALEERNRQEEKHQNSWRALTGHRKSPELPVNRPLGYTPVDPQKRKEFIKGGASGSAPLTPDPVSAPSGARIDSQRKVTLPPKGFDPRKYIENLGEDSPASAEAVPDAPDSAADPAPVSAPAKPEAGSGQNSADRAKGEGSQLDAEAPAQEKQERHDFAVLPKKESLKESVARMRAALAKKSVPVAADKPVATEKPAATEQPAAASTAPKAQEARVSGDKPDASGNAALHKAAEGRHKAHAANLVG